MITIRHATKADAQALAEFGARSFYDTFASENTQENMIAYLAATFSEEKQLHELTDSDITFFIAEADGTIAGTVKLVEGMAPSCITGSHPIEISRLYVDKKFLRSGIGSKLMDRCFTMALKKQCDVIWLGVWEHNYRARDFYRVWGFHDVGSHIFQLGDDAQTDLLMERLLFAPNTAAPNP